MTESILGSIKKALGLPESGFDAFDATLVMHINSVFMVLDQVGVGPSEGYAIEDAEAKWADFLALQPNNGKPFNLAGIKTFMYLRVKMAFDPPQHGPTLESMQKTIDEYEWRLKVQAEEAVRVDP